MPARVAVVGDVSATPSLVLHTDTAKGPGTSGPAGAWTAGTIAYESYPQLSAAGAEVIWQAECEFSFTGTDTGGSPVDKKETVTLTATANVTVPAVAEPTEVFPQAVITPPIGSIRSAATNFR